MIDRQIVLASASPRRKFLLEQADFEFTINASDVDETVPDHIPIKEAPEFLAVKKAKACDHQFSGEELILAADTSVFLNDTILNKPASESDAKSMLKSMSKTSHEVITGVALRHRDTIKSFSCVSKVVFDPLSNDEIEYYIKKYKPMDKAGAYGIQDWIGWCKISRIEGSYSNIFGLPMRDVYNALKSF